MAGERTSCIVHPAQVRTNVLREEYLGICQAAPNTHCAAMLLSMFEHWTNYKFQEREEIARKNENAKQNGKPLQKLPSLWVFMSQAQMKTELFGLFGETIIMKAVAWLRDVGLIKTRENRVDKWDRTLQYLLKINVLQQAVTWWLSSSYAPRRAVTASRPYKKAIETVKIRYRDRKNTQAIPQGLSQGQSQGEGNTSPPPQRDYDPRPPTVAREMGELPKNMRLFLNNNAGDMYTQGLNKATELRVHPIWEAYAAGWADPKAADPAPLDALNDWNIVQSMQAAVDAGKYTLEDITAATKWKWSTWKATKGGMRIQYVASDIGSYLNLRTRQQQKVTPITQAIKPDAPKGFGIDQFVRDVDTEAETDVA